MDANMLQTSRDDSTPAEPYWDTSDTNFHLSANLFVAEPWLVMTSDEINRLGEAGAVAAAIQRKYNIEVGEDFARDLLAYVRGRG